MTWLAHKAAAPIAAALAAALLALSVSLGISLWLTGRDLEAMTVRAERAEKDLGQARANSATLEAAVSTVNAQLAQMNAEAAGRESERLTREAAIDATLRASIAALKDRKPGADKCASASALIKDFAK